MATYLYKYSLFQSRTQNIIIWMCLFWSYPGRGGALKLWYSYKVSSVQYEVRLDWCEAVSISGTWQLLQFYRSSDQLFSVLRGRYGVNYEPGPCWPIRGQSWVRCWGVDQWEGRQVKSKRADAVSFITSWLCLVIKMSQLNLYYAATCETEMARTSFTIK